MSRPTLLDLFCKAGGASKGYMDAGFLVVGVDIEPQPRYIGHAFYQADALEFLRDFGHLFDVRAGSPPCQKFSAMTKGRWKEREHADLVGPTRELMRAIGGPYVIENVMGAPLDNPTKLCGTMFGLQTREGSQLRRHRLFETNWALRPPRKCAHNNGSPIGVYGGGQHPDRRRPATKGVWGSSGGSSTRDGLNHYGVEARKEAMGIDWMNGRELSQAIPPAYTRYIGEQLLRACFPNRTLP